MCCFITLILHVTDSVEKTNLNSVKLLIALNYSLFIDPNQQVLFTRMTGGTDRLITQLNIILYLKKHQILTFILQNPMSVMCRNIPGSFCLARVTYRKSSSPGSRTERNVCSRSRRQRARHADSQERRECVFPICGSPRYHRRP